MQPTDPGHPRFVESARRHLVRYGVDRDEAISLAVDLTKKGFMLESDHPRFKRFIDAFGLVAQSLQLRHQSHEVRTRAHYVDGRDLVPVQICLGFTLAGAIRAALADVDDQRAAALQFHMRPTTENRARFALTDAEMLKAGALEEQYGAQGEHPDYTSGDWQYAHAQGWTDKPYWEWVTLRIESIETEAGAHNAPGTA